MSEDGNVDQFPFRRAGGAGGPAAEAGPRVCPDYLSFAGTYRCNRTTVPGQRCRVVGAGNPPLKAEEEWVIQYEGPWLNEQRPDYPAVPGELKWFAVIDGKEEQVADGKPFQVTYKGKEETVQPLSRTFIPALLEHSPDFAGSNYRARLQGLPEPMRSQLLYGDAQIARLDDDRQMIPSEWVRISMGKWKPDGNKRVPHSAATLDCARGGDDRRALAKQYGNWGPRFRRTRPPACEP